MAALALKPASWASVRALKAVVAASEVPVLAESLRLCQSLHMDTITHGKIYSSAYLCHVSLATEVSQRATACVSLAGVQWHVWGADTHTDCQRDGTGPGKYRGGELAVDARDTVPGLQLGQCCGPPAQPRRGNAT